MVYSEPCNHKFRTFVLYFTELDFSLQETHVCEGMICQSGWISTSRSRNFSSNTVQASVVLVDIETLKAALICGLSANERRSCCMVIWASQLHLSACWLNVCFLLLILASVRNHKELNRLQFEGSSAPLLPRSVSPFHAPICKHKPHFACSALPESALHETRWTYGNLWWWHQ